MSLKIGDKIPDLELKDQDKETVKLSDFKGKRILLSFHPLAWTGICAKQMQSLEDHRDTFTNLNTIPLGISVDTIPSKKAWADHLGIKNTRLLSDFWPHGEAIKKLGIFREHQGISERANIIINEDQEIIFLKIYEIGELPDINEIIGFLKDL